jgi:hypothetical protein
MIDTKIPLPIPNPSRVRSRLSELATEANFLRALLRLLEKNRSGQRLLKLRHEQAKGTTDGR